MRCSVENKADSTIAETLTNLWQRVLQKKIIRYEDNFFELGGDAASATELFREIAQVCGQEWPPAMIYAAPTIQLQESLLLQSAQVRFPRAVLLKPGSGRLPVFVAHGMGGSVLEFFDLTRCISTPHPIYGIQARGTDGLEEPLNRIEDMARFHVEAIREVQPHGPYYLIGHSLGGLIMLEVARWLRASGENVALLSLVDAYPAMRYLKLGSRVRLIVQLATRRASTMMNQSIRANSGKQLAPTMQRVLGASFVALKEYRPHFYQGEIKFVRAAITTVFPDDPAAVWSKLAKKVEVETSAGDHHGMLATEFASLAAVLSRYLSGAPSS